MPENPFWEKKVPKSAKEAKQSIADRTYRGLEARNLYYQAWVELKPEIRSFIEIVYDSTQEIPRAKIPKKIQQVIDNYLMFIEKNNDLVGFYTCIQEGLYGDNGFYTTLAKINTKEGPYHFVTLIQDPVFVQSIFGYFQKNMQEFSTFVEIGGGAGDLQYYLNTKQDEFPNLTRISIDISPHLLAQQVQTIQNEQGFECSSHMGFNRSILDPDFHLSNIIQEPCAVFANELPDAFPFEILREREGEIQIAKLTKTGVKWENLEENHPNYIQIYEYYNFLRVMYQGSFQDLQEYFCFTPGIENLFQKLQELPAGSHILLPDYYSSRDLGGPRYYPLLNNVSFDEFCQLLPLVFQNTDITFSPFLPWMIYLGRKYDFEVSTIRQNEFIIQSSPYSTVDIQKARQEIIRDFPPEFDQNFPNPESVPNYPASDLDPSIAQVRTQINRFYSNWVTKYNNDPYLQYLLASFFDYHITQGKTADFFEKHPGFTVLSLKKL